MYTFYKLFCYFLLSSITQILSATTTPLCDMTRPVDVVTVGSTLLDSIHLVSDEFLSQAKLEKGTVCEISQDQLTKYRASLHPSVKVLSGGSAANSAKGLGKLGAKVVFVSRSGSDQAASIAKESISKSNVELKIAEVSGATAQVTCLITPDGQRSFFFTPGNAGTPTVDDLNPSLFASAKVIHHEGYNIRSPEFFRQACQLSKEQGALCSLDLGSFALVRENREVFLKTIDQYVDILFGNADEMLALYESESALETALLHRNGISVVLLGKKGCIVYCNGHKFTYQTDSLSSVDTTGAGDLFVAGFIYGITHNFSLENCARLGNWLGGEIVLWLGGEIPNEAWSQLMMKIQQLSETTTTTPEM